MIPPENHNRRLVWNAADIVELMGQLEDDRRWKPLSLRHQHKKTRWEIHRELVAIGQAPPVFSDLEQFAIPELLRYLVEAELREVRELFHTAIMVKVDELEAQQKRDHLADVRARN